MEKLNEYLSALLSSCSDELHLEPARNPYLISADVSRDLSTVPILSTQISMMVFPLIPPNVRAKLPHSSEVEFVHANNLGNFNFVVKKSPAGFNVTIRPTMASATDPGTNSAASARHSFGGDVEVSVTAGSPSPDAVSTPTYEFESSSAAYEYTESVAAPTASLEDMLNSQPMPAAEYDPSADVEIVSANDPSFETVFSDTSTYEPPGRRDDYAEPGYDAPMFPAADLGTEMPIDNAASEPWPPSYAPAETAPVVELSMQERMDALFRQMAEAGASDLHLSVSMPPMIRKDGKMCTIDENDAVITPEAMRALLTSIMPDKNREEFEARHDTDFAYEIVGLARFRCNVFMDRKGMGAVFRIIPSKILTAEQLGLSKAIMDLCALSKGLVVVTGPTGSGKSTTLCAMVDSINKTREDHIITIEDPIEFVHENQKCLVNQREVHNHTDSFKDALRAALREDPDILLVGEMRDLETISIAIETAETGHLVFGTLHTTTAASTVDRIIDQFPADRQQQIRVMLSESLKGVIAQTLLPKKGGGRVAALEVLIVTPAISNLIREGKTFQIPSAMQTGKNHGMVMLNDALFEHVKNGLVEPRDAYIKAVDKTGFETLLQRGGFSL